MFSNLSFDTKAYKIYKTNILENLVNQNKDLAAQGTPEWHAVREFSIGGSEMSVITGDNPFQKLDKLVAMKVGFTKFAGNIACKWGKMFEVVTQNLTQVVLDADRMYETGSLEGSVPNQRYSPDGLAVIKLICESNINGTLVENKEYCIVLFEYKSPYSSIPKGIIPKHYMPQVKTGLCSIPITDFAIFINNLYRKCSMGDLLDNTKYHTDFHTRDTKLVLNNPLALGVNIIYQTEKQKKIFAELYGHLFRVCSVVSESEPVSESESDDDPNDIFNAIHNSTNIKSEVSYLYQQIWNMINNIKINPIDFGKSYYKDFNEMMELYDNDVISIHYCNPHIFDRYYENEFLLAQGKKSKSSHSLEHSLYTYKTDINNYANIIGFIPWKLFMSDIIYEGRDAQYAKKYDDKIQNTINIIKEIRMQDSDDGKVDVFKKHFPKSKILKECGLDISDAYQFIINDMD
jgi:hypothetical protein